MIRALSSTKDIEQLRCIHEKYYKEEFTFPDFLNGFIACFIVENEQGEIVSGGGVRAIAESIIVTDKLATPRARRQALLEMLQAQLFVAGSFNYEGLHVFIQDDNWKNQLLRYGFRETKGKSLIIG